MENRVVFRQHDDNDGNPHESLSLVETLDGDLGVAVETAPGKSLRFREPNCGGGTSPRTWAAPRELFAAMEADNKGKPHHASPLNKVGSKEGEEQG